MSTAILLSGGMDSVALAFWKQPRYAFTVNYGQSAFEGELRAARFICSALNIAHIVIEANCLSIGSGRMAQKPSPDGAATKEWWPYRNQLLITLAAMHGVTMGIAEIFLGTVRSDSIYADGTALFFEAIDRTMSLQEGNIRINAPALEFSTAQLVRQSGIPFDLLSIAHSCNVSPIACGQCRSCIKHQEAMSELGYQIY